jgi:hypothetical protein
MVQKPAKLGSQKTLKVHQGDVGKDMHLMEKQFRDAVYLLYCVPVECREATIVLV